jgi:hypothetical protein
MEWPFSFMRSAARRGPCVASQLSPYDLLQGRNSAIEISPPALIFGMIEHISVPINDYRQYKQLYLKR